MSVILGVEDFKRLPEHRRQHLRQALAERGIDFHHVVRIEKHPHTWTVTLLDQPPHKDEWGYLAVTTRTVRGGRW
jgi:hypothetical protein